MFCMAAAGFLTSVQAVNEAFPPKRSRAVTDQDVSATQKEDRIRPNDVASEVKRSSEENAEGAPHICTDLDGKPFGWSWANVPFAAMKCDIPRQE